MKSIAANAKSCVRDGCCLILFFYGKLGLRRTTNGLMADAKWWQKLTWPLVGWTENEAEEAIYVSSFFSSSNGIQLAKFW